MLVAHFIPIVRTFAPVTAGAGKMNRKQFVIYDAIGDIAWTVSVTLSGYFIGSRIPGVEHYIEPVLIGIVLLFLGPTLFHMFRDPRMRDLILRRKKPSRSSTDDSE
jgi:membrane-associated protein